MDRIVPSLMGVSKAILENVIFVHQASRGDSGGGGGGRSEARELVSQVVAALQPGWLWPTGRVSGSVLKPESFLLTSCCHAGGLQLAAGRGRCPQEEIR